MYIDWIWQQFGILNTIFFQNGDHRNQSPWSPHNHLKVTTSLSQNSQQAGNTNQGDHRNWSPGSPQIQIQAHTMHWNITKFLYFTPGNTHPDPSRKSNQCWTKNPFTPVHQPRWTRHIVPKVSVFNCAPPPYAYTGTGEQSHKFH